MDFPILSCGSGRTYPLLAGFRVEQVSEDGERNIFILLRDRKRKHVLFISPDRSLPRMHLIAQKPVSARLLHSFTQFLKSRMRGGRIMKIRLLNEDRIVEILFSRRENQYNLVFELIRPSCNLVLHDGNGIILAVYYPVPADDRRRPLRPGIAYHRPERKKIFFHPAGASANGAGEAAGPGTDSANRDVETYYERLLAQQRFNAERAGAEILMKKQLSRAERRYRAVSTDLKEMAMQTGTNARGT